MLSVSVTGRHFEVTEAVRKHVEEKLVRLSRHFDRLTKGEMVLAMESGEIHAELSVLAPRGNQLFAKAVNKDVLVAVDEVMHRLERQIDKFKERLEDHRRGAEVGPAAAAEPEAASETKTDEEA